MNKYLARNHKFYINDGANWLQISGIRAWSFEVQAETDRVSQYKDGGWEGEIITKRRAILSLQGFFLAEESTRDGGQAACEDAARLIGYYATRGFRVDAIGTNANVVGYILISGAPSIKPYGGEVTTVMPWEVDVSIVGQPLGSGVYGNLFPIEEPVTPTEDLGGLWTGVGGLYTYSE